MMTLKVLSTLVLTQKSTNLLFLEIEKTAGFVFMFFYLTRDDAPFREENEHLVKTPNLYSKEVALFSHRSCLQILNIYFKYIIKTWKLLTISPILNTQSMNTM